MNEKWTWIVVLERLMDFKIIGKSPYNAQDMITTRGFMGQAEFERGKFNEPPQPPAPVVEKVKEVIKEDPNAKK